MQCSKCNASVEKYANAHHKLCMTCNNQRLQSNKQLKQYKYPSKDKKSSKAKEKRIVRKVKEGERVRVKSGGRRMGKQYEVDNAFYEQCFNSCSEHKCEECGEELNTEFLNADGKVAYRARYSHIVQKSKAPELRHDINNINHLCFNCHFKWEFGDKKSMKIYNKNTKKFPQFFR